MATRSKSVIGRTWVFYGGVSLFAFFLVFRLFSIQVVHGEDYRMQAEHQYVSPAGGLFDRGTIYFTERGDKEIAAATLKSGFTIAINPEKITDAQSVYDQISKIIPIDAKGFFAKAAKAGDPYEEIAKKVSESDGKKIQALGVKGIEVVRDKWRFYPAGETGSQILGFVGYNNNTLTGQYGLERYYNDVLKREDSNVNLNFFAEVFSNIGSSLLTGSNDHEGDVVTSIDPTVQQFLDTEVKKTNDKWNSTFSGGIVMDPNTGTVYAMSYYPTFDPNKYAEVKDVSLFKNPNVEGAYEMGSIVKALTMAAGLDVGVVKPDTTYDDKGTEIIDGRRVSNYDGRARGVVNMQTVLDESLNMGAIFVQRQLGEQKFKDYMRAYGIGKETGIDLPNETAGLASNLDSPREVAYATASFGQGVAVSPIAITRALSVLANGGKLITPHVATRIEYPDRPAKEIGLYPPTQVLKPSTSETITNMLIHVFDDAMLGGTVKMKHYSIAAKTGTAQIARPEGGYYADGRYMHTYFGYFPAYDPRFIVFLYTNYPKGEEYASHTLTGPFVNITKFLINYYQIPPDR